MGQSIDTLSDRERIVYYRGLALDALGRAHAATTDYHKAAYLDIATRWTAIADEVERWMRRQEERAKLYDGGAERDTKCEGERE